MSGSAPEWVTYAALTMSVLAVLVSGFATRISYLSYRASGPRLRLTAVRQEVDHATRRVVMLFTVVNEGRGEVSIQGFKIVPYGHRRPVLDVTEIDEGPILPTRLAASSSSTWQANVLPVAREYDAALRTGKIDPYSSWPSQFYFVVCAGNGTLARDRVHQFDARQLIAEAFPPQ